MNLDVRKFWANNGLAVVSKISPLAFTFLLAVAPEPSAVRASETSATPAISQACAKEDFRENFGPMRDQGGLGICWAMVGADLLSEAHCELDPQECGKNLSALDVARCDWSPDDLENSGGIIRSAVECGLLAQGVCEDRLAPLSKSLSYRCWAYGYFAGSEAKCWIEDLETYFSSTAEKIELEGCFDPEQFAESAPELIRAFVPIGSTQMALGYNPIAALSTLAGDPRDTPELIMEAIIPPACRAARHTDLSSRFEYDWKSFVLPGTDKRAEVARALQNGRSIGLSLCANPLLGATGGPKIGKWLLEHFLPVASDPCGAHTVIANASRVNPATGVCELHLRNSWGEGAPLNGWYDADTILAQSEGFGRLKERKIDGR